MKRVILLVLLFGLLLTSCAPTSSDMTLGTKTTSIVYELEDSHGQVQRFVDREAGVVCYVTRSTQANPPGIFCLPLSETLLNN